MRIEDNGTRIILEPEDIETADERAKNDKSTAHDGLIAELATLDRISYDQRREGVSEDLGIRVATLDKAVADYRKAHNPDQGIRVYVAEPSADAVDGDSLLCELADVFGRYLVLADNADSVLALWTLNTYTYDYFETLPYLIITSPEKRCGKNNLMRLLSELAFKPLSASNISAAALYRVTEKVQPTLLIDEADTFLGLNDELRGILNGGYTKYGSYVIKCAGDDNEPHKYSTWAPKAIAGIRGMPDTIEDRSIIVRMRRKKKTEQAARLRNRDLAAYRHLPGQCRRWAIHHADSLKGAEPDLPSYLNDRCADISEPLLAICGLAGGEWRKRLLKFLQPDAPDEDDDSLGALLLADIRDIFVTREVYKDRIHSSDLALTLADLDDRPWADHRNGKPITSHAVAQLLRPFGICPRQIRIGELNRNGYEVFQFGDAFERYL